MLKQAILVWVVLAVAIAITAELVPSVNVDGGILTLLWVAFLFGLVNAVIGPLLHLLAMPITIITFGLFALVVNAALLALTAGISSNLDVGGFFACVIAALLISVLSTVLEWVGQRIIT